MQLLHYVPAKAVTREFVVTPRRHPSSQLMANFLVGDCSPGSSVMLTCHMSLCDACNSRLHAMGATGVPLSGVEQGVWRVVADGVEASLLSAAAGIGEAVYLLRAAPGARIPLQSPIAAAEILVLEGRGQAGGEAFVRGDYAVTGVHGIVADDALGCTLMVTALLVHDDSPAA